MAIANPGKSGRAPERKIFQKKIQIQKFQISKFSKAENFEREIPELVRAFAPSLFLFLISAKQALGVSLIYKQ